MAVLIAKEDSIMNRIFKVESYTTRLDVCVREITQSKKVPRFLSKELKGWSGLYLDTKDYMFLV